MTHDERLAVLEANDKNIFHQLNEMKEEIKVLRELATAVQQLADKQENNTALLLKLDSRLEGIESRPREDLNHYKRVAWAAVISGAIGAALSAILTLI